jgi:hypothetical protein
MARVTAALWRLPTSVRALGVCSILVVAGLILDLTQHRAHETSLPFVVVTLTVLGLWGRAEKRHRSSEPTG